MDKYLRMVAVGVLALAIILSCTVLGNKLTDPASYSHTIETLDKNRTVVLGLSAASSAASAAVSTLPDDICSSISEQLSEITSWFMMILGFVYLEKYLLTVLGAAACYILLPVGCGALLISLYFPKTVFKGIGTKFVAFAAVVLLVIPTSVLISDHINEVYSDSIQMTVESAGAVSDSLIGKGSGENGEESATIDEAGAILSEASGPVGKVIEKFKNVLNRFIEATAVMIVTTCLIPILVVLFFMWIVKTLFNAPIVIPTQQLKPKKAKRPHDREERGGQDI